MRRLFGTVAGFVLLLVLATALPRADRRSIHLGAVRAQGPPDNYEPNDRWAEAVELDPGVYQSYISHDRDLDWFKVHVPEPGSEIIVTLSDLPADYDLALLGDPARSEAGGWALAPMADLAEVDPTGQLISGGSIYDLGSIQPVGALRAISVRRGTSVEEGRTRAFDGPGWYYMLVKGYNSAYHIAPYTLRIQVIPPPPSSRACSIQLPHNPGVVTARWLASRSPETLILLNKQRFDAIYGLEDSDQLLADLRRLAEHPAVQGLIQPVENDPDVAAAYDAWDADACSPETTNRVTRAIKDLVEGLRLEFPTLHQLLIVGADPIIPFHRVPDLTRVGNERGYANQFDGDPQTPLTAALAQGMILTDDFYADGEPLPWRGRELYVPDQPIGRLVETPHEIMNAVRAFLNADGHFHPQTALVLGSDPLISGSREIETVLRDWGILPDALIGDGWDGVEMRAALLNRHHDVSVINTRTAHNRIFPPVAVGGPITAEEMAEVGSELAATLILSAGSHMGLNVPDLWAESGERLDFSQVFTGLGAVTVANTGYAYGGAYTGDLSENLALLFAEELGRAPGSSVGEALVRAKRRLFDTLGPAGFSVYHEKSLLEATLYGLPMLEVRIAGRQEGRAQRPPGFWKPRGPKRLPLREVAPGLAVSSVQVVPHFQPVDTPEGTYFSADAGIAIWPGRPIQPRVTIDLTEPDTSAHGVLLARGQFRELRGFDPVIARPLNEGPTVEPGYPFPTWWPRDLTAINRIPLSDSAGERLVAIVGQYRHPGVERLYQQLTFDIYYSTAPDYRPPVIWRAQFTDTPQGADFNVWVSDASGIQRVVVTYTRGGGQWQSLDLQDVGMNDQWFGFVPRLNGRNLEFFVQAVDGAGNVAVHTDKGRMFRQYAEYLPVVRR